MKKIKNQKPQELSDHKIEEMILKLIEHIDYDIYKEFALHNNEETEEEMKELMMIVKKYLGITIGQNN
jgi:hypothetical protein